MGRSAKFHKRQKSSSQQHTKPSSAPAPQEQKRRAGLKAKASRRKDSDGPVLGGADYVQLMMGGRRKAREEAAKLPKDNHP